MVLAGPSAQAEGLRETLKALLADHDRVIAAEKDSETARNNLKAVRADWFPELKATTAYGYEIQRKGQGAADTHMPPRDVGVSVTQKVWDFGKKNAEIDTARLKVEQSEINLERARQTLLLEALTAHLDLRRKHLQLDFARQSEGNIKKQTGVEEARVQRGGGYPTDVLQAKTQLADAQAQRVETEGEKVKAANRYQAVFRRLPEGHERLAPVAIPQALPEDLGKAMDAAKERNPQLAGLRHDIQIARSEASRTFSDGFFPEINVVGKTNYKQDYDGTIGGRQEHLAKVEMSMPFNAGLKSVDKLRAAEAAVIGTSRKYAESEDLVIEKVKNAWQDLVTAREKADYHKTQAMIAEEFLVLARKERQNGTRSLIDVLQGEVSLINARSRAVAAETDIVIAAYTLLFSMGVLDLETVAIAEASSPDAAPRQR